jgi:GT2 family glycosyltransferase
MDCKILTIIVTFNGMKWIDKCILSVISSSIKSDIFVVDNASSDGTPDYIAKNFPTVLLTRSPKNLGFGAANNIGLQYAIDKGYDYVYLLNQDAWVKEDTFEKLISIQKQHPEYGILSPMQLDADERKMNKFFGDIVCSRLNERSFAEDLYFKKVMPVYSAKRIMAAHWLISKKCLFTVGGFSPSFYHYGEDDNYSDRVWYKGFKIGFCPQIQAVHDTEHRIPERTRKSYLRYCRAVSDICGFEKTAKQSVYDYAYDIFLAFWNNEYSKKTLIKYFLKLLINISSHKQNKKISKKDCAFLSICSNINKTNNLKP